MERKSKIKFNIVILIAIILLAIATIPKTLQEDTFYMIKVGEYICQNGMKVVTNQVEPFAWHEGLNYRYPHWLMDVVIYLIYHVFDIGGIYLFTVLVGICLYVFLYYTNVKIAKNHVVSGIITIGTIYLLSGYITARSQIITYIACMATILGIERFIETKQKRYVIELIVASILVANCHAALFPVIIILYLPYIVEYIVSWIKEKIEKFKAKRIKANSNIEKIKDRKIIIEKDKNAKWLIPIFIVILLTGFITPIKSMPYTYMIKSIQGNTMNYITEHQAVALIYVIPLLAIFMLIQILLTIRKTKIRLRDLIMLIGMSLLALISYKQLPIFIIGTMCIINKMMYHVINQKTKEKISQKANKVLKVKNMIYAILGILLIALLQYKNIAPQSYIDKEEYPVLATSWLKTNVEIDKMKLFNDFNYGSYLLYKDIPVFIDGRADLYDPIFSLKEENIFLDYMKTTSLEIWYEDTLKKYGITHIITKTESNFNTYIQRNINCKNIYNDGSFSIYEYEKE